MHAYMFGSERTVSPVAIACLVVTTLAVLAVSLFLRQRLSDNYPAIAEKYSMGGMPSRGIGIMLNNLYFIWGGTYRTLEDGTVTALVWSGRGLYFAFAASLVLCWITSTPY